MDRRRFIRQGASAALLVLGGGGALFARRAHARRSLAAELFRDALPPLKAGSLGDLDKLPALAGEEIRRYFHAKCFNASEFVEHVCSDAFSERLGRCPLQSDREYCFVRAFCERVVTEAEILEWVGIVASEIGRGADASWSTTCGELSVEWNARMPQRGEPLSAEGLAARIGDRVRAEVGAAAREASTDERRPALGETVEKIGASAVLLLPLARLGPLGIKVGIPLFFLLAARDAWDYAAGLLGDRRADHRAAISGRLALLGNRVGAEFEREVRIRLTDLHIWRARAIGETAELVAAERVGLL